MLEIEQRVAQIRSFDATPDVPEPHLNLVTESFIFCFLTLCCISLLGIAKELEPLLIAIVT